MNVLFILPALTSGGAERVLITLMNKIDREQFSPSMLTVSDYGSIRHLLDDQIPYETLNKRHVTRSFISLYKAIKRNKPDVVVSTMAHLNLTLMMLRPFFPKTKFVIREAITISYILHRHPILSPFLKLAYKTLYARANLVISPAQAIIDEFSDLGLKCNNHALLHNPVDLERIRRNEQLEDVDDARQRTVHFVAAGRLNEQKGFDRLIAALPNLKMNYDWRLTIYGKGTERRALKNLIDDLQLSGKVKLAGHTQSPWSRYAEADCFLMPSRWEGLPNVILESLACGTPSIVTAESGGIAEIQEKAGNQSVQIVSSMDEFITAMSKVAPHPSNTYRGSLLPDYFSIEAVVKRFEGMLKSL